MPERSARGDGRRERSQRRIAWASSLALLSLGVVGCQTIALSRHPPADPRSLTAPPGEAVVYVFRPRLDSVGRSDSPTLLIDTQLIARLPYASYTPVMLKAGRHQLVVMPNGGERDSWRADTVFEVQAGVTYYVALWNPDQPLTQTSPYEDNVPGAHGLVFVPVLANEYTVPAGVKLVGVSEEVAAQALANLKSVPARVTQLAPKE